MADFQQAIKWLKEGKKIRRKGWGERKYRYLDKPNENVVFRNQRN